MVSAPFLDVYCTDITQYITLCPPPNSRQAILIKVLNSIHYMNKDLVEDSAVWRALHGVRGRRFCCLSVYLSSRCQRAAENGFAADDRSVSGDGRCSRCCTLEEFSQDCDWVSVRAVQEKCDEKRRGVRPVVRTFPHPCFAKCAKDGVPPVLVTPARSKAWATRPA